MKAEEIRDIVNRLDKVKTRIGRLREDHERPTAIDVRDISGIWWILDRHRWEMEAAEKQPTSDRLATIEKRIGEIRDRQDRHLVLFHEMPAAKPAPPTNAELRAGARSGNGPPAWWWNATDDPFTPEPAPSIEDVQSQQELSQTIRLRIVELYELSSDRRLRALLCCVNKILCLSETDEQPEPAPPVTERNKAVIALLDKWMAEDDDGDDEDAWARLNARLNPPSVEVEMRLADTSAGWTWRSKLGQKWVAFLEVATYTVEREPAIAHGNTWLASLSDQLGVKLVPKWVTDKQDADAG